MKHPGTTKLGLGRTTWWLAGTLALAACSPAPDVPPPMLIADPPPSDGGIPGAGQADLDRGMAYVDRGSWSEAVPYLERAVRSRKDDPRAWYFLGLCRERGGDLSSAERNYKRALELDGGMVAAAVALSAIYLDESQEGGARANDAVEVLARAAHASPGDADLHENLALAYRLIGEFPKAEEHYRKALKAEPNPRRHFAYGDMLFQQKRFEEAAAHLRSALPAFDDDAPTLAGIAQMLAQGKSYAGCVKAFDRAIELKSDEPEWFMRRGLCRHELKNEAGARADFEKVLELDPKSAAAHYHLGMSWKGEHRILKAGLAFEKAMKLDRNGPWGKKAKEAFRELHQR